MKYYIFEVKDNLGNRYFIVNNCYLDYVGFDSNSIRSILEYGAKVKRTYKLFASGVSIGKNDNYLHKLFCNNRRISEGEAEELLSKGSFAKSRSKKWYELVWLNTGSSKTDLCEVGTLMAKPKLFKE